MTAHFTDLPDEILTLIAAYIDEKDLYACTLINRQCYRTMNMILWRTINIGNDTYFTTLIACLLTSPDKSLGHHVRFVDIFVRMNDPTLLLFAKLLPNVRKLKLHNAVGVTDLGLIYLSKYCPLLTTLHIINSPRLTRNAIGIIGKRFPHLWSLHLCDCYGISPKDGTFAALKSYPLRKLFLDVGNLASIHDMASVADLVLDLVELPHLTNLLLIEPTRNFNRLLFTIVAAKERNGGGVKVWPNLEEFCLTRCRGADNAELVAFLKTHPRLSTLSLCEGAVDDLVLDAIVKYLPLIQIVDLTDNTQITAAAVRRMAELCIDLGMLTLRHCRVRADAFPEANDVCLGNTDDDDDDDDSEDDDDLQSLDSRGAPRKYLKCLDYGTISAIQQQRQEQQEQQHQ